MFPIYTLNEKIIHIPENLFCDSTFTHSSEIQLDIFHIFENLWISTEIYCKMKFCGFNKYSSAQPKYVLMDRIPFLSHLKNGTVCYNTPV